MRRVAKSDLDTLRKEMEIVEGFSLMSMIGGLDERDCLWRCIAYLASGGNCYSSYDAYYLAQNYYGSNFDPDNYGFSGSGSSLQTLVLDLANTFGGISGHILTFNLDEHPYLPISGVNSVKHSVIVLSIDGNGVHVFDPQQQKSYTINPQPGQYFVNADY